MKWTKAFIPTLREDPQDAEVISHKLLIRGGFIRKLTAGSYSYLPLGFRVLHKVINIVREEMNRAGAIEVFLPALHPLELWKETGRDKTLADVMIKFRDRHGRIGCLGPTHEEVITSIVAQNISSYRELPRTLYQIQTKFRDEMRPRFGIVRTSEFIMKDAYSFDVDFESLEKSYKAMYDAYCRIFSRCGLPYIAVNADPGVMGGGESHEFMVPTPAGEDIIGVCESCGYSASKDILLKAGGEELKDNQPCPKCKTVLKLKQTIEIGHTFKLGLKYTEPLKAYYLDNSKVSHPIVMGCYGIGVNRLIASAIEVLNDKDGIIWPVEIAPYQAVVQPLNMAVGGLVETAQKVYNILMTAGIDVIMDDRDERAGIKFKDADLIGFPLKVIIGEKNLKEGFFEIKARKTGQIEKVTLDSVKDRVNILLDTLKK